MQNQIDSEVLTILGDTCGAACHYSPSTCSCFGPLSGDELAYLGVDMEDYGIDDVFYKKEECAYYDKVLYESTVYVKGIYNIVKSTLKDADLKVNHNQLNILISNFINDDNRGIIPSHRFAMEVALMSLAANTHSAKKHYVYLLHTSHSVKIGRSSNPIKRTGSLDTKSPFETTKIDVFEVDDMYKAETYLHRKYSGHRVNGEWFKLNEDHIQEIKKDMEMMFNVKKLKGE